MSRRRCLTLSMPACIPPQGLQTIGLFTAALSRCQCECGREQSAGLRCSGGYRQRAMVSSRNKHCLCASGAEVDSRACPARHGAHPGPGAEACRAIEADLGAGRRLAAATAPAGGRRASCLHIHVRCTHATSLFCHAFCFLQKPAIRYSLMPIDNAYIP